MPRRISAFFLMLGAVLLWGCQDSDDDSEILRLGYTPSDSVRYERGRTYEALCDYLSKETGKTVKLVKTSAYQPAIAAMGAGEIDIMNFGSQAYLIAEEQNIAEAFALKYHMTGELQSYSSLIIVPSNSPYQTVESLLADASQLKALYTNTASTSGYLVPKSFYADHGIDTENSFKQVGFTQSHALSILRISNRQADLAHVSSGALRNIIQDKKIDPDSIRVLWQSFPIPSGPVAVRATLPSDSKAAIKAAYLAISERDPQMWKQLVELNSNVAFVYKEATREDFDQLRKIRFLSQSSLLE